MRVYKNFISPDTSTPDIVTPPTIISGKDALNGGVKPRQRFRAVFASDEELKLGIAGKGVLGVG